MKRTRYSLWQLLVAILIAGLSFALWREHDDKVLVLDLPPERSAGIQRATRLGFEGDKLVSAIATIELLKSPKWKSGDEHPPVDIRDAIRLGWKGVRQLPVDRNAIEFESAEIARYEGEIWYWVVNFRRVIDDGSDEMYSVFPIIVLMDRRIAIPEKSQGHGYHRLLYPTIER